MMQFPNALRNTPNVPNLHFGCDLKIFRTSKPLVDVNGQGEEGGQSGSSGGTNPQPDDPCKLLPIPYRQAKSLTLPAVYGK